MGTVRIHLFGFLLATAALAAEPKNESRTLYEWKPDGGFKMTASNNDPSFELQGKLPARLPAGATLTVRMAASAGKTLQIFWGGDYNETDSLCLPLTADGKMHDYTFRFPRTIALTRMRMDPTDAPGYVHIERVLVQAVDGPEIGVGAFFMDGALPRAGRPERVCALLENTGREPGSMVATLTPPADVRIIGPAEHEVALKANEVRLISWQIQAANSAAARLTLSLAFKDGGRLSTDLSVRFAPAIKAVKADYVPPPVPAKTRYLVGAMHFPGWKEGTHIKDHGWRRIVPFPERKPALGWYDEHNPEVTDWEIKWALEHGLSFFNYCWYRNGGNVGKPLSVDQLHLGHGIHEGFFKAKYRDQFKFTIMWENANAGGVASMDDMMKNLLPFWIKEYFSHPSYLKIDNQPVLFVYDWNKTVRDMGGTPEKVSAAWDAVREACRKAGFGGLVVLVENRGPSEEFLKSARKHGFDGVFPYCNANSLTSAYSQFKPDQAVMLPTVSMGWNPAPWGAGWEHGWRLGGGGRLAPETFQTACAKVKEIMDALPAESFGHRMMMIDNWNEWGEGHYILPHRQYGFGYLDAIRSVFATDPGAHEDLTPEDVGRGPYDTRWQEALKKENFGPHDSVIRELLK